MVGGGAIGRPTAGAHKAGVEQPDLVAPGIPAGPSLAGEQLELRCAGMVALDNLVDAIRLAAVLTLLARMTEFDGKAARWADL